jgi:hypothetical protein
LRLARSLGTSRRSAGVRSERKRGKGKGLIVALVIGLGPMKRLLESGNFCAYAYYPEIRVRYVQEEEIAQFNRDQRSFMNVNTPEEFEKSKQEASHDR